MSWPNLFSVLGNAEPMKYVYISKACDLSFPTIPNMDLPKASGGGGDFIKKLWIFEDFLVLARIVG